jgi:hypothetical protein
LTRRANHRHIFIIARNLKARAGKPAAGFFNRTAAAFDGAASPDALPQGVAGALPSERSLAGTRDPAGDRLQAALRW